MGQITITLTGRTFRLRCKDGEEERLLKFSDYLNAHLDRLEDRVGQVGHDRLLLMAALTITGELWDAKEKLERLEAELGNMPPAVHETPLDAGGDRDAISDAAQPAFRQESL